MFLETRKDGERITETVESWRKLLLDAAEYLETRGRSVGDFQDANRAVCVMGALNLASGQRVNSAINCAVGLAALRRFSRYLVAKGISAYIPEFSDTATCVEIVAAMRDCANAD